MNRHGSLPEFWGDPLDHNIHFDIERLQLKVEGLQMEIRTLHRQMGDLLQTLQRSHEGEWARILHKEIVLPTYAGTIVEDANEYLRDIEQYLIIKNIPEFFQPKIIANSLKDRARVWFNAVRGEMQSFNDFSNKFKAEFLTEEISERAKAAWRSKRYVDGNIVNYYYMRFGEAIKFYPPLSPYKINKTIIMQMPQEVQFALVGIDLSETQSVVRALARIDEARNKVRDENKVQTPARGQWQSRDYIRQGAPAYNNRYTDPRPRYEQQRAWPSSNLNVNIAGDGTRDRRNNERPGNWREKSESRPQTETRKLPTRNIREVSAIEIEAQPATKDNFNKNNDQTHEIQTIAEIHACDELSGNDYAARH